MKVTSILVTYKQIEYFPTGGPDPERMAPLKVEKYVTELFANTRISVQVISDEATLKKEYPLLAAVNRGASVIPRHAGRVIFLTYEPQDPNCVLETLMFVGKGVTYDTGGNDIKVGGAMAGMSRDKCGAAACVGLMQVCVSMKCGEQFEWTCMLIE